MINSPKKLIIGSGLIAKSFIDVAFEVNTLVFASGVSNSQETRATEFQREADLFDHVINRNPGFHVLYCSTCSIDSVTTSPYIAHKLSMEQRVRRMAESFHIFRLPQLVGLVKNKTLVSYFVDAILHDRVLIVQSKAARNLLDVTDFARIAKLIVNQRVGINTVQNIASANNVQVLDIVEEIARLLGRIAQTSIDCSGYSQDVDIGFLRRILPADDVLLKADYWREVLHHYVPRFVQSESSSLAKSS